MRSLNSKYLLSLLLLSIAIYLMWMDVTFYLELQKLPVRQPNVTVTSYAYSPFSPITVKQLMLLNVVQFIDEPLAYLTVYHTRVAAFISPNGMSFIGVIFGALAARLFIKEDLKYRQFGVLLFAVRDYIDALDGSIHRERQHSHSQGHVVRPASLGYAVDGVCDGLSDFFRLLAFMVVLQRYYSNNNNSKYSSLGYQYTKLDLPPSICSSSCCGNRFQNLWSSYKKPFLMMLCIGIQFLMSSFLWNYFMYNYHNVLETDLYQGQVNTAAVLTTQNQILKSSAMWMVCYFWRLVNPQTMTQIHLLAILYNKETELCISSQYLGFLPPLIVAFGSYTHLQYAAYMVKAAAFA